MPKAQAQSQARDRWEGHPERLADVLCPYVCRPNFVIYDVSKKAVLNKPEIIKHRQLIRALANLWSFRQETMTRALAIVLERREGLSLWFDGDQSQATRWPEVQSARVRTLLRHWSQSVIKSRGYHTGWVRMVQGGADRVDPNQDGTQLGEGLGDQGQPGAVDDGSLPPEAQDGDGQGAMAPPAPVAVDDGPLPGALPPEAQDGDAALRSACPSFQWLFT